MKRWTGPFAGVVAASLLGCAVSASARVPGLQKLLFGDAPPAVKAALGRGPGATADIPLHDFYFARVEYTGDGAYPGWKDWETDFPKADRQFLSVLKRLASVDAYEQSVPVRLDDPDLRRLPYIYAVEVGHMDLTSAEARQLRDYLEAGGFFVVDDFWGSAEWGSFARQMAKVFPDRPIVDIPRDHPLFHSYYDIDEVVQVPNQGNAEAIYRGDPGATTVEEDGFTPVVRGIFDDDGRLMVAINWNTDLGDGWEWAEQATYPLRFSTYAMRIGVNMIVYAMSH